MAEKTDMELALEMVRRAAAREVAIGCQNTITRFMGYSADDILRLRTDRDQLFYALRRLVADSMQKDHPEATRIALAALAGREEV